MIACAPTISPPPPTPCRARDAMSWPMSCDRPHNAEPTRNTTIRTGCGRVLPRLPAADDERSGAGGAEVGVRAARADRPGLRRADARHGVGLAGPDDRL